MKRLNCEAVRAKFYNVALTRAETSLSLKTTDAYSASGVEGIVIFLRGAVAVD